jgi:dTDP-glucose 4,6-dehydratase
VPNFVAQALKGQPLTVYGDGQQTRSFCYVADLVEGVYRLLLSDEHMPTNVGNPREMTVLQFAELINAITGNTAGIVFEDKRIQGDPQTRRPDITKARRVLNNWEPKVEIEDGLRRTVAYFRKVM